MTICGQNWGGFKCENNEFIRNGENTKLHEIKIVVSFLFGVCGAMTRNSSRFRSLWRRNDVKRDETWQNTRHITTHAKSKTATILILYSYLFSAVNTFIVLSFKTPLILTIYGHVAGNLNFFNNL